MYSRNYICCIKELNNLLVLYVFSPHVIPCVVPCAAWPAVRIYNPSSRHLKIHPHCVAPGHYSVRKTSPFKDTVQKSCCIGKVDRIMIWSLQKRKKKQPLDLCDRRFQATCGRTLSHRTIKSHLSLKKNKKNIIITNVNRVFGCR